MSGLQELRPRAELHETMTRLRTFIAVEASPDVQGRASALIQRLRTSQAKVSWTKPENMHLTLKFLGDTDESLIPDICRRISQAADRFTPFRVAFAHAGAFPSIQRPRTLWLGVAEGAEQMIALQAEVESALRELRFPREHRRFNPHLTLGRVRGGGAEQQELAQLLTAQADFVGGTCEVDELVYFASYLEPAGPTYQVLSRAPLAGT